MCLLHSRIRAFSGVFLLFIASATISFGADLSGHWTGYWRSDSTGHRGPLRCTFTKLNDSQYRATFSGRFFKVIPFRYSVVLDAIDSGDVVTLSGAQPLGRRLGTFYYSAEATDCDFSASYSSCKDSGVFVLCR